MADISSLYPQPQQNGAGSSLLSNPGGVLGLATQAQQLQRLQAERGVGSALQGAVGPDGTINTGAALSAAAANPNNAYAMPAFTGSMLAARGQQIANDTGAFNLAVGQNSSLQNAAGSLANAANPNEAIGILTDMARRTNLPTPMLTSLIASMPTEPKAFRKWAGQYASVGQGPGAANTRSPIINPDGSTSLVPQASLNTAPSGLGDTAGPSGGLAPMTAASQGAYVKAQGDSANISAALRPANEALKLLPNLSASDFGPGSNEYAQAKALLIGAKILPADATDVPIRQEFNKYLHQMVGGITGSGRSDEAQALATASSPNTDLTQPANTELLKNIIAMQKQNASVSQAYDATNPGDKSKAGFNQFQSSYFQNTDLKAFRFDTMTPQERRDTLDGLGKPGSPAYQKFINSLRIARSAGAIMPDGGAGGP
jgi:hypothetical protein